MKKLAFYSLALVVGLTACISSQKVSVSWVSPEVSSGVSYKKVFVAALTDDLEAKKIVEEAVSEKLKKMGVSVVKSIDAFPPNFSAYKDMLQEDKIAKIRETGSDAIFSLTLLDVVTEERYNPGTPYTIESERLLFYRHYLPYYKKRYAVVYTPDYYTTDKTFFIESNLYDVESEKIVWTVQSTAFNPSNLSSWFKEYSILMLEQLKKDGLIASDNEPGNTQTKDLHTSRNSLDWIGNYSGILPCASCEGIETELRLNEDITYTLKSRYIGEEDKPETQSGSFIWLDNNIKLLGISRNERPVMYKVEENRLRQLDMEGNVIKGDLEKMYLLIKEGNPMAENKKWVLTELNGNTVEQNPETHYLVFHTDDNRLEAKAGCNTLLFKYKIQNNFKLTVIPGISTRMACPKGSLEPAFIEALKHADNFTVSANELSLNKAKMAPLARFKIAEP